MIEVLLVDDQPLIRAGLAAVLELVDDVHICGEAEDGRVAVDLAHRLSPAVVLMDIELPGLDGIAAAREIVRSTACKVVMLTTFNRDDYLFEALHAGASGFVLKASPPEAIAAAVRAAADGHALLSPEVTVRLIAATRAQSPSVPGTHGPDGSRELTDRENEVLLLVARGLSNAEIAAHLVVGEATVKTHVSSCLSKLGLRDRVQAVVYAYTHRLVPEVE
ncbi:response regulator transcription factor [Yimella sp. NH-Cas1]|uniref:response regulator n=1 Tax=Yimella sp. NH-Cas1 TaxID=2917726 RepID=UPI001EFBCAFE|nr:response regulator transcription factor [Yimella sp. NH-Cas1]MCG8654529.1 response regulator transcription factor [Yimella sp. NH-Cas1]